jgi:hypothetical protein
LENVFILILLFSIGYIPNLQVRRKNIVETSRDRHGTTTKTPLEQHSFHQGQSSITTMKLLAIPC